MRMNRVLEVDYDNQIAVVEPGLVNLHLSWQVGPRGYYYAPDPSSQQACTIGGNIANNSGGPHTLKYGVTTNHVLGLEVVMPDGEIVWLGGKTREACGYDLAGVFVGSEGTFGIATRIVVRILKKPQAVKTVLAVFDAIEADSGLDARQQALLAEFRTLVPKSAAAAARPRKPSRPRRKANPSE
jgi:glycolate oxidase